MSVELSVLLKHLDRLNQWRAGSIFSEEFEDGECYVFYTLLGDQKKVKEIQDRYLEGTTSQL